LLLELFAWLSVQVSCMHGNVIHTLMANDVTVLILLYNLQFVQGNAALYVKYTVKLENQYPYVIALLLFCAILWMPLWQFVIIKYGKKTAFFISMWILMFMNIAMLFADFYPYSVYPLVIIGAMGVASAYLLPW
jgi:Na+/melibiose symporter-like transporter